jgi:hypothetical protein
MPAAKLALTDVNNKKDLLPDFQLTLHSNDSEVGYGENKLFLLEFDLSFWQFHRTDFSCRKAIYLR